MKTLRLAVPLALAAFTLTCQDQPADPLGPGGLSPVFVDTSCGGALGDCFNGNVKETVPSVAFMNTPQVTATDVSIGFFKGFNGNHYQGVLDEFRFWNVARSGSQIAKNMNKALNLRKANGLVAYWRMNEGSGQVAADASGNGHDMQLGNTGANDAADPAWVAGKF